MNVIAANPPLLSIAPAAFGSFGDPAVFDLHE
jgi:hypothetical protein